MATGTATDLIASIQSFVTPDVLQRLATLVGETPAATQKAMKGVVPTMLGGVLNLGSQPGGISQLQALLPANDSLPENLGSMLGSNAIGLRQTGQEILGSLFGGKLDSIVDSIASTAGARTSAVSSLLTLVAPLILSVLGRRARSQGLTASGLVNLLATNTDAIAGLIPPSLASVLGLASLKIPGTPVMSGRPLDTTRTVTPAPARPSGWVAWWPWALGLGLLLLFGIWYAARSVPEATRKLTSIALPGGGTLNVEETSLSYSLARYLANPNDKELSKPTAHALYRLGAPHVLDASLTSTGWRHVGGRRRSHGKLDVPCEAPLLVADGPDAPAMRRPRAVYGTPSKDRIPESIFIAIASRPSTTSQVTADSSDRT